MEVKGMETKRHGLSEREMKLVELLMADCQEGIFRLN